MTTGLSINLLDDHIPSDKLVCYLTDVVRGVLESKNSDMGLLAKLAGVSMDKVEVIHHQETINVLKSSIYRKKEGKTTIGKLMVNLCKPSDSRNKKSCAAKISNVIEKILLLHMNIHKKTAHNFTGTPK